MENNFKDELDILNDVYSELIDAIENKPEVQDYEKSRIYTENLISYLNKWVVDVKNVRNLLEKREPIKDITADNRPA
ncbi:MAG TPA: hypothetical protein ENN33_12395 [Ignavibacteria bacterium]|nr:hypothetical protein [Ignavibacteria bacterium]